MQSPVKTLEQGSVSTATQTSLSIISWENPTPNTEKIGKFPDAYVTNQ